MKRLNQMGYIGQIKVMSKHSISQALEEMNYYINELDNKGLKNVLREYHLDLKEMKSRGGGN